MIQYATQQAAEVAQQVAHQTAQQAGQQVAQQAALTAQVTAQQVAQQAAQQVAQQAALTAQMAAQQVAQQAVQQAIAGSIGQQQACSLGNAFGQYGNPQFGQYGNPQAWGWQGGYGNYAGQQQPLGINLGGGFGYPGLRGLNPFAGVPLGAQTQFAGTPRFSFA